MHRLCLLLLQLLVCGTAAYRVPHYQPLLRPDTVGSRCMPPICLAKKKKGGGSGGKGFGAAPKPSPSQSRGPPAATFAEQLEREAVLADADSQPRDDNREAVLARGRAALEALRSESGTSAAPMTPSQKLVLTPEELAPISPEEGVMPEVVSNRMLRRVVPFAGLPVAGSVVLFGGFYFANTQLGLDLPPSIVAYSTQALLLLSFAGITYGVMSTSWDEEEEGSFLGFEEAKTNVKMALGDAKAAQARAKAGYMEDDAAKEGVYMSKRAMEKAQKKKGQ